MEISAIYTALTSFSKYGPAHHTYVTTNSHQHQLHHVDNNTVNDKINSDINTNNNSNIDGATSSTSGT